MSLLGRFLLLFTLVFILYFILRIGVEEGCRG